MAKSNSVRVCVDRIIPLRLKYGAATASIKVNKANAPRSMFKTGGGVSAHPVKIALETKKMWPKGRRLRIRFLNGTSVQRERCEQIAVSWLDYANLKFSFVTAGPEDIRVSFQADPGSWSAVGTDALFEPYFPKSEPTMNYGWLYDDTDAEEWQRVVLHEFGHAIGAIHEHQSPKGGLRWRVQAVYDYFSGPPNNWSKEEIDFNVLQKYSLTQLNASRFDRKSIMLYAFPGEFFVNGRPTPSNTRLSTADKAFIRRWYPK